MTEPDYVVILSDQLTELQETVMYRLRLGYEPCGGVTVICYEYENHRKGYTESATMYYQAVWLRPTSECD